MGKYNPLEGHLRRQKSVTSEMSFRDIERVLGVLLPKSAHRPEWWGDEPKTDIRHVQARAWLNGGFLARPDIGAETIHFERLPSALR